MPLYEQTINFQSSPSFSKNDGGFFNAPPSKSGSTATANKSATPTATQGKSTKSPTTLIYPTTSTLGNYFVKFVFEDHIQDTPLTTRKILEKAVIILPIPNSLQETHGMGYSEKTLGLLGILEKNLLNNKDVTNILSGKLSAEELGKIGKNLGLDVGSPQTLLYLGRGMVGSISDQAGNAVERITGTVLNPFQALQFTGVNLREHTFTYRFSPNNADESLLLKKIIKTIKVRMHPDAPDTKGGALPLFNFPDTCDITFGPALDNLYYINRCFLKNMTVNYAPQGIPSFFAGTNEPVEIEMTLQFGEVAPLVRADIIEQYKSTESGEENTPSAAAASADTSTSPVTQGIVPGVELPPALPSNQVN